MLNIIILAVFLSVNCYGSEFENRAARASEHQKDQEANEAIVRASQHDEAMLDRVHTFASSHGGATISQMRRFDGYGYGYNSFRKSNDILELIEFTTGDGLACRSEVYDHVIDCYDSINQPLVFRIGPASDYGVNKRRMRRSSKK